MKVDSCDFAIIGGGLFGIYAALYLGKKGYQVILFEKEAELCTKASVVNQARLHGGYHYPRSVATAQMSDDHKERFTRDHEPFINFHFEKYYAIDRFGSFTDSLQFERFCHYLEVKCEKIEKHPLFNFNRIESLYATKEFSFDPYLIANFYKQQLSNFSNIKILTKVQILGAEDENDCWKIEYVLHSDSIEGSGLSIVKAANVINATYAATNAINQMFGVSTLELMHEISEMAFVTCHPLQNIGLTVMDGQFGSLMPYGLSGLLSLSSVAYTHHKVSYDDLPTFDCQKENLHCQPGFPSNCNACPAQPVSNYRKMESQISQYLSEDLKLHYFTSLFTIKSKLQANYIDDGRPTEISLLHEKPAFYCIFAGKINSIYEVEKLVS